MCGAAVILVVCALCRFRTRFSLKRILNLKAPQHKAIYSKAEAKSGGRHRHSQHGPHQHRSISRRCISVKKKREINIGIGITEEKGSWGSREGNTCVRCPNIKFTHTGTIRSCRGEQYLLKLASWERETMEEAGHSLIYQAGGRA
jgi:hypothetical protein